MAARNRKDTLWAEAKRKCRLNAETVRMAKELGMNPRSLIKNIPDKSQPWKAPVRVWIRDLYERRIGRPARKRANNQMQANRNPRPPEPNGGGDQTRKHSNADQPLRGALRREARPPGGAVIRRDDGGTLDDLGNSMSFLEGRQRGPNRKEIKSRDCEDIPF